MTPKETMELENILMTAESKNKFDSQTLIDIIENQKYPNYDEMLQLMSYKDMQKNFINHNNYSMSSIRLRTLIVKNYGIFGFSYIESIQDIIQLAENKGINQIIDIGAGIGYLSYGIKKMAPHLEVIAIDIFMKTYNIRKIKQVEPFYNVQNINAKKYLPGITNSLLILSWPNYKGRLMSYICKNYFHTNTILYIGENQGGCTANDAFFKNYEIERYGRWYPFDCFHDRMYLVKEKDSK